MLTRHGSGVTVDKALQALLSEQLRVENAVQKLEPYLVRHTDGTFILNVNDKTLRQIGVAPETLRTVQRIMESVNRAIKHGELESNESGQVFFTSTGLPSITANENRIDVYWYGIRWGLSNALTQQIAGLAGIYTTHLGGIMWGTSQ